MRIMFVAALLSFVTLLSGCEEIDVREASLWKLCDQHPDICDSTHSGALCTIPRSDAIRHMAINRVYPSSINAYKALKVLDKYKGCLEDAYVSEAVRNKDNKQSQIVTIQRISEVQQDILASTRRMARPEINLWLWQRSQSPDHMESMKNGLARAKDVHQDVYVALMLDMAKRDIEKARDFAVKALNKVTHISDIPPNVYEFYVGYYLDKNDYKAAVWQGLYSALDEERAEVNADFFQLYNRLTDTQIKRAQREVEGLLFDEKWLNKTIDAFPKTLI